MKEFFDNIFYLLCYPLRIIDKHTGMFTKRDLAKQEKERRDRLLRSEEESEQWQ